MKTVQEVLAIVLLLCCFIIRFRLSDEALHYLLKLIKVLLPEDSKMVQSFYTFRRFISKFIHTPQIRHFCSFCYTHVDKDAVQCPNTFCSKDLKLPGSKAYFVLHSLMSQLQMMFKRKSFTENVRTHRFKHYKEKSHETICVVYDGSLYKQLYESGFLNNRNNLSFGFNTDGVPLFKS